MRTGSSNCLLRGAGVPEQVERLGASSPDAMPSRAGRMADRGLESPARPARDQSPQKDSRKKAMAMAPFLVLRNKVDLSRNRKLTRTAATRRQIGELNASGMPRRRLYACARSASPETHRRLG